MRIEHTAADLKAEIAELERLLQKRRGKPGFGENVAEIEKRLGSLTNEVAALEPS